MQMKKNRTASSSLWETSNDWDGDFISNEHSASAANGFLFYQKPPNVHLLPPF